MPSSPSSSFRKHRHLGLVLAGMMPVTVAVTPLEVGPKAPRGYRTASPAIDTVAIAASIREEMRATQTPGASIAVVIGDSIVYAKGFGVASIETGAPVTPDMLFRVGR